MRLLELVKHRRSVRSYTGSALSLEDTDRILQLAADADNPYHQPIAWKILDAEKSGLKSPVLTGVQTYIAGKMKRAEHAEEAFGFSFESIVLAADDLGIGTCWIAGTMNRNAFESAIDLQPDEVMPCISPLGYPAGRMSLKETMMRKGIRADERLPFGQLFFDKQFDSPLSPDSFPKISDLLEIVRWAPSAVNKQPWRIVMDGPMFHFYEQHSRGYVENDSWDIQKIDMGIALCHFALAAREQSLQAEFVIRDPGIPVPPDVSYTATYILT